MKAPFWTCVVCPGALEGAAVDLQGWIPVIHWCPQLHLPQLSWESQSPLCLQNVANFTLRNPSCKVILDLFWCQSWARFPGGSNAGRFHFANGWCSPSGGLRSETTNFRVKALKMNRWNNFGVLESLSVASSSMEIVFISTPGSQPPAGEKSRVGMRTLMGFNKARISSGSMWGCFRFIKSLSFLWEKF